MNAKSNRPSALRILLAVSALAAVCGCATYAWAPTGSNRVSASEAYTLCQFEAEITVATIEDLGERHSAHSRVEDACMRAKGFRLVRADG